MWRCSAARCSRPAPASRISSQLSQRIGRTTGGIWPQTFDSAIRGSRQGAGLAVPARQGDARQGRRAAGDPARRAAHRAARQPRALPADGAGGEGRARGAAGSPGGHGVVDARLRANLNEADWAAEQIGGDQLPVLPAHAGRSRSTPTGRRVQATLEQIAPDAARPRGDARQRHRRRGDLAPLRAAAGRLPAQLPVAPVAPARWLAEPGAALRGPDHSRAGQLCRQGRRPPPARLPAQRRGLGDHRTTLRTTWLWEQGARAGRRLWRLLPVRSTARAASRYLSYRDPNLLATLDIYDQTAHSCANRELERGRADQEHHRRDRRPRSIPAARRQGLTARCCAT